MGPREPGLGPPGEAGECQEPGHGPRAGPAGPRVVWRLWRFSPASTPFRLVLGYRRRGSSGDLGRGGGGNPAPDSCLPGSEALVRGPSSKRERLSAGRRGSAWLGWHLAGAGESDLSLLRARATRLLFPRAFGLDQG